MFTLTSRSYPNNGEIPLKYVYKTVVGGKDKSPEFSWDDPPITTKSFALSIVDPHPVAKNWVHWLVVNIPFRDRKIVEGASGTNSLPAGAKELLNSYSEFGYGGPAPPKGSGEHPYITTLYALNIEKLDLPVKTSLRQFENAIEGKVIAEVSYKGIFEQR